MCHIPVGSGSAHHESDQDGAEGEGDGTGAEVETPARGAHAEPVGETRPEGSREDVAGPEGDDGTE